MVDPPGPLGIAASYLDSIGMIFESTAGIIAGVPIVGEYLASPFYDVSQFFRWCAYYLNEADARIETFSWDDFAGGITLWVMKLANASFWELLIFQDHFLAWVMYRLGFNLSEAYAFEEMPTEFIHYLIWKEWSYLENLLQDAGGWIRDQLIARFPALEYLFEDPEGWVLYMLGVSWFERIFWKDHLLAWLLQRWGMPIADALMFEANPIAWVEYQVLKRWPLLDDLVLDPIGWVWTQFRNAIDRYIDIELDWLVRTAERLLNSIWQMRM